MSRNKFLEQETLSLQFSERERERETKTTLCAKNETRVISNILHSCNSIAMNFST